MGVSTFPVEAQPTDRKDRPPTVPDIFLPLLEQLAAGRPVLESRTRLVEEALEVWARPGFDTFVCAQRLRFQPFPYQVKAAQIVLRRMRGRAILADEVGLGKTIEAGIVASELRLRGLAPRMLVLSPVGLLEQWREELDRKFVLPSELLGSSWSPRPDGRDEPILLASLAAARRPPLRDALTAATWDLVVVDEAHRLKNPRSASARLVRSLRTRYLLLLTATPVENRLDDLFQLVSLVSPGLLGAPATFRRRHGPGAGNGSAGGVRNLDELRSRLAEVMVRHRRSEVPLMLPGRLAETIQITPAPEEAELYRLVSAQVRSEARTAPPSRAMALLAVQRLAGSSPAALAPLLQKVGWADLAERASRLPCTKSRVLLELLRRHGSRGEKVVVFTAFRQTLHHLRELAAQEGITASVYHGSLSRRAKDEAIESFRTEVPVLITTEAAGEGRNLQFCHALINFDLPWNPMQIEQRLGRIHRIGQTHEVLLTNLVCMGTVEERILRVLESKINLFELVVGELDMIIGRIEEELDFEHLVFRTHVDATDDGDFDNRLEALGEDLARARRADLDSREATDALVAGMAEDGE